MATPQAVWVPEQNNGQSATLAGSASTGVIFIGKRRIFRIWTDNPSGLNINFGLQSGGVPTPTSSDYSIGTVPQDWDTGDNCDSINLANNSSVSSCLYFIQICSRF